MTSQCFILAASLSFSPMILTGCDDAAGPPTLTPAPPASVSLEWQQQAGNLVASNRMSPLAAGRVYAALSMAQYRAAKATEINRETDGAAYEARRGAVAGASVQVLKFIFPAAADSLETKLAARTSASTLTMQAEFDRGIATGRTAGDQLIEHLKNDGFTRTWSGTAPNGPGSWIPVTNPPAGIMLGNVTPYFLTSGSQFRPAAPPAFGSAAFEADLNEVLQFTQNRTADQLALAKTWDYSAGTTTPVGYWNKMALDYIAEKNLDELAATRVFGLMHAAVFDAQIACWDAKYHYWMVRPYQANSQIALALGAPNHPAFPSGHSCVSASAARVLAEFFPERADELTQLVIDAGMSRIYAGIHYRFDVVAGQRLGTQVAEWAINRGDL
jgi:hypothetical protein